MSSETLTIESPILNRNERLAAELRERFRAAGVYVINVLSSPGSGKTSTILEPTRACASMACARP